MNAIYILWLRAVQALRPLAVAHRRLARPAAAVPAGARLRLRVRCSSEPGQGNYIQFLAPGVIAMRSCSRSIFSGIEVIWDRQFGFLKETLVAPVPRILHHDRPHARAAPPWPCCRASLVFVICLAVGFRIPSLTLLPLAFVFLILTALLFTAFGTALGCLLADMQGFQLIMNFLVMPIFFLSGALFP